MIASGYYEDDDNGEIDEILTKVYSLYGETLSAVSSFVRMFPRECKASSQCKRICANNSTGEEVMTYGVIFVHKSQITYIPNGAQNYYSHELSSIINIKIDRKTITIRDTKFTTAYIFPTADNNVIMCINNIFDMRGSCIKINNEILRPNKIKIVMLTIGSRGDVQPFVCLAKRLIDRGYNVKIVTHKCFKDFITTNDIDFHPLSCNPKDLLELCVRNTMFSVNFVRESMNVFLPMIPQLLKEAYDGCMGANILLAMQTSMAGPHIAEKLQIPFFNVFTMPNMVDGGKNVLMSNGTEEEKGRWYTSALNTIYSTMADQSLWMSVRDMINEWRQRDLNLAPKGYTETFNSTIDTQKIFTLYCYSPTIYPKQPEWSNNIHVTGYWREDVEKSYVLSTELSEFLVQNKRVALISFGSVPIPNVDRIYEHFIAACRDVATDKKLSVIVCKGWSESKIKSSKHVFVCDQIPYDNILKHVKLVCHHGGAGTTASCILNKVPMIIIPYFGDQFFWGKRVQDMRLGYVIPNNEINDLTMQDIVRKIVQYDNDSCNSIGLTVIKEDGIATAIKIIEENQQIAYISPTFMPNSAKCSRCDKTFGYIERCHHCRNCGECFCNECSNGRLKLEKFRINEPVRICDLCYPILSSNIL
jgi:UDP:flavonoid glycosyltransferase YjiC (YdhE family)